MNPHRFARLFFSALFLVSVLFIAQSARSATWTLGAPDQLETGIRTNAAASADYNKDGYPDLALTDNGATPADCKIAIYLGQPPGLHSWSLESSGSELSMGVLVGGMAAAGFTGSGHTDLATSNFRDNAISVLLGNGNGTFLPKSDYTDSAQPNIVGVADFGNGHQDVFTPALGGIMVFMNDGTGSLSPSWVGFTEPGHTALQCVAADFDGDTLMDMAVLDQYDIGGVSYEDLAIFKGKGDGTFGDPARYSLAPPGTNFTVGDVRLAACDFNSDGKPDLALLNIATSEVAIFINNGEGTFTPGAVLGVPANASSMSALDLDNHGNKALVVTSNNDTVSTFLSNGDGTFQTRQDTYVPGGAHWLATADMNRDGVPDIVTGYWDQTNFSVLPGNLKYDLTVMPSNGGWVHVTEVGPFDAGALVNLEADPWDGWKFAGWTGPVADANAASTTVTMNSDTTVTPLFTRNSIHLWMTQDGPVVHLRAEYYKNNSPAPDGAVLKVSWRYKLNETDPWPDTWSTKSLGKTIGGTVSKSLKAKAGYYQFQGICMPKGQPAVKGDNVIDCKVLLQPVVIASGPDSKAITPDSAPAISWQAYDGATGYLVQTSMKKNFKAEMIKESVYYDASSTSGTIPGLVPGIKTFWRVVAILPDGISTSVGSTPRQITCAPAP